MQICREFTSKDTTFEGLYYRIFSTHANTAPFPNAASTRDYTHQASEAIVVDPPYCGCAALSAPHLLIVFMRSTFFTFAFVLFAATVAVDSPAEPLERLLIAGHALEVEIADTPAERERGLMFRQELSENHGMLFVFSEPQIVTMWMKNTLIDLDVAFIDSCGRILNIERMKALSLRLHSSYGLATYALEVKTGWFADRGLVAGLMIEALAQDKARCAENSPVLRAP